MSSKELRCNTRIKAKQIRLIDEKGEQKGIVSIDEALKTAVDVGLDLVEVAPDAKPPVCKLLDYGKYKFDQEKLNKESKKKSKQKKDKEIRMQPKIEEHDLQFKAKHIREFLDEGYKVKVTIRFRGREMVHTDRGVDILDKVLQLLGDSYVVEKNPKLEGKFMSMLLKPKSKK
ncbi:MAG: translation initiation factor IF-3 [Spirochaetales bacterium]|nr:translation initiation factor IF-3 [Spirochaetales bacterium]